MKRGLRMSVLIFLVLPLMVMFQSCVVATKETTIMPQIRDLFKGTYKVDPYMEKHKPQTVAVLPFINLAKSQQGSD